MSEIEIGTIVIPDRTRNGFWIPIPMEDSAIDYRYTGMEAVVVGRVNGNKVQLQHLISGTQLWGMVEGDYYEEVPKIGSAQSDLMDGIKNESQKPFTTKKKCEDCDIDYPDDFKYCERCGKELDITHKKYYLDEEKAQSYVSPLNMKWDTSMYPTKKHSIVESLREEGLEWLRRSS
jgi:hypothetical protein